MVILSDKTYHESKLQPRERAPLLSPPQQNNQPHLQYHSTTHYSTLAQEENMAGSSGENGGQVNYSGYSGQIGQNDLPDRPSPFPCSQNDSNPSSPGSPGHNTNENSYLLPQQTDYDLRIDQNGPQQNGPNNSNFNPANHSQTITDISDGDDLSTRPFRYCDIPLGVYLIIIVEMCERFSFYGLASMLVLFLNKEMHFSEPTSKTIFSSFTSVAYFAPLFGSIMGDSLIGRYWTIALFSFVYVVGSLCLVLTASSHSEFLLFTALFLIALGTSGLKPNVNVFGAQALNTTNPEAISAYFSMFYFSINVGGLISTILLPIILRNTNYVVTFIIPAVSLFVALLVFASGKRCYTHTPPTQSLYVRMLKICCASLSDKRFLKDQMEASTLGNVGGNYGGYTQDNYAGDDMGQKYGNYAEQHDENRGQNGQHDPDQIQFAPSSSQALALNRVLGSTRSRRQRVIEAESDRGQIEQDSTQAELDGATALAETSLDDQNLQQDPKHHWLDYAKISYRSEHVEEIKQALSVLPILPFMILFWLNFDQQQSSFPLQADKMDRWLFNHKLQLEPSQVTAINSICILIFVPFFDSILYPFLRSCFGLELRHLNRMVVGMFFTIMAFLCCAWVDYKILHSDPQTVSILWQLPQYVLVTLAEVLISVSGIEYVYTQTPPSFRSTMAGFWGCTVALGDLTAAILFSTVHLPQWQFSLLCAGLMFVDMICFFGFKCWFHRRPGSSFQKKARDGDKNHNNDGIAADLEQIRADQNSHQTKSTFSTDLDGLSFSPDSIRDDSHPNDQNLSSQTSTITMPTQTHQQQYQSQFEPYDPTLPFESHTPEYREALVNSVLYPRGSRSSRRNQPV